MTKYNLTKGLLSEEDRSSIKEAFESAGKKVDRAEALVRSLDLTNFELRVLAQRLLNED